MSKAPLSGSIGALALALGLLLSARAASAQNIAAESDPSNSDPALAVCRGSAGYAADFGGRRTFLWRPAWLAHIKNTAQADLGTAKNLMKSAQRALQNDPYSVTHKAKLPPDASPHDYASIGPYWWPDPAKSDGLPYVRKDGEVNPERDGPEFDKDRLRRMSNDVRDLALAFYITEDPRFAEHAAKLIRIWFIEPDTRMNPQFEFAQGIPGRVKGRGEGLIEASHLSTVIEAAGLLGLSGALSPVDQRALQIWYRDFVVWMATSKNGDAEMRKGNNHGLYYDFYLAHFALFAGADGVASNVAKAFPKFRLARQMDKQGRFIEELKRTRSWHYSVFAVEAGARLATISECVDVDLWGASLEDGRGLKTARAFLLRYAHDVKSWPFPDRDLARGQIEKMTAKFADLDALFPENGSQMEIESLP